MPSVNYYNRSAPLWDFIASMEEQGASTHGLFANRGNNEDTNNPTANDENNEWPNPWTQGGWPAFGLGFPHRGRGGYGPPHGHHHGPPPPPPPPPAGHDAPPANEKEGEAGPSEPRGPPPPPFSERPRGGPHRRGGSGSCRGRGRGGGLFSAGSPVWGTTPDGRPDPRGFFNPMMGGTGAFGDMVMQHLFGEEGTKNKEEDFKPEVDVFDTAEAFVVHVSLPGAKKEDVGVNWDAEKSELNVAGVIYRPGDEEFLKTLAMDERKIGAFERKVRLGSRANPAHVDVDGITAKMEDGVLTVEVPKLDSGYVEIKKVDIE